MRQKFPVWQAGQSVLGWASAARKAARLMNDPQKSGENAAKKAYQGVNTYCYITG